MSEYSTELLRKVRKELNDIELYLDKLNSQKYNRMKDAIWELKALDLSDKQIAHLLSLVFVDEEDVIYEQITTINNNINLLDQLKDNLAVMKHNCECLLSMYNDRQLRNSIVHNCIDDVLKE